MPTLEGPEGLKAGLAMMRAALPDLQATIETLTAEGDLVTACTPGRLLLYRRGNGEPRAMLSHGPCNVCAPSVAHKADTGRTLSRR